MKHLKTYKIFESAQALTEEQEEFLIYHTRGTWSENPSTGMIDIHGSFDCCATGSKDFIGIQFGYVSGNFDCANNLLKSLKGSPKIVNGDFDCSFNNLKTLKEGPESVGKMFSCHHNSLTSLEGSPRTVGRNFLCTWNSLNTLEGAPKSVGGYFRCYENPITSLNGAPQTIGKGFYCPEFETLSWNLDGKLKILQTGSPKAKTLISPLVTPEVLQELIDQDPVKAAVDLKSVWKTLKSDPKFSDLKFPEGYSKEADLLADLNDIGL